MRWQAAVIVPLILWGCNVGLGFEKRDGWPDSSGGDTADEDTGGDADAPDVPDGLDVPDEPDGMEVPDGPDVPDAEPDIEDVTDPDADEPDGPCTVDGDCPPGQICRHACFGGRGCGRPPDTLVVDCPDSVTLPASASCTIDLDGVAGQSACLDCEARLGVVTLSSDDFGTGGSCTLGGWSLTSGPECTDSVDSCTTTSPGQACCDVASSIHTSVAGDCMLQTDLATNCGGGVEEWRLVRTFDTRGLDDIEVCFRISGRAATADEGILLYASDSTHDEQASCLNGMPLTPDGSTPPDGLERPFCATLPAWTADNPALVVTFIAHSENAGEALFLDDVVVRGWSSSCTPSRTTLFTEDFSTCSTGSDIADGWNGWSVTAAAATLQCLTECSSNVALGMRSAVTMSHAVDTTAVDGDVRLCFDVGDRAADAGEWITVSFDAGTGWQEAWRWDDDLGTDGSCASVCVVLSDIDPAVALNPDLVIRFELVSNHVNDHLYIDDVLVDGATFCPAGSAASISGLADLGGGSYSFDLVDDAAAPMGAAARCSWDTPPELVAGLDTTWFRAP